MTNELQLKENISRTITGMFWAELYCILRCVKYKTHTLEQEYSCLV